MRSYKNPDIFFKKMKKKPALQAVIDNLEKYSEADINAMVGPHFPAWVREQLIEMKKRNGKTSEDVANEIAAKMIAASKKD
jgi:hypothetical protein